MILSYHPHIFMPLKRLTQSSWKERLVVQCVENRIAVYSPHTSYDAVKGGVNDWLVQPFGKMIPIPLLYDHSIEPQSHIALRALVSMDEDQSGRATRWPSGPAAFIR